MSDLNWDRLTVLLVEDNQFVAGLLRSTLHAIGFRNMIIESDGSGAIKRLQQAQSDPVGAGFSNIDLIISDFLMPTVDGALFLRWIRTSSDTFDRFVPFIMLSGAADRDVVQQCRQAGVTEFLAKPFSVSSVAERILHVINHPRAYILAPEYFGPDRRRKVLGVKEERRSYEKSDIEHVYSQSSNKSLRDDVRAIHFHLPNRLREKLGPNAVNTEVAIDPEIIAVAEERIQDMAGDYSDWMSKALDRMSTAHAALVVPGGPPGEDDEEGEDEEELTMLGNRRFLGEISRTAHELRGQGGIFGYPLITSLGRSLFETTKDQQKDVTANRLTLIGAHIDAIRTVFANRIRGEGGEIGRALLKETAAAVQRYA